MPIERVTANGLEYLRLGTELLQRQRIEDPLGGIWEAADLQWWWRLPRTSDAEDQVFWLDECGPLAGVVLTDWTGSGGNWTCDPILLPRVTAELRESVWREAIQSARALAPAAVEVAVRDDEPDAIERLTEAGFRDDSAGTMACLTMEDRQPVTAPTAGYRLVDRTEVSDRPHHFAKRNGVAAESRLRETSLYDPRLDLALLTDDDEVAAYGLFWFDPITRTGLVEPMRTEDEHQRKGLAGHLLRAGAQRLADRGALRVKIHYVNEAAGSVYRAGGFLPTCTLRNFVL